MHIYFPEHVDASNRQRLKEVIEKVVEEVPEELERAFVSTDSSEGAQSYFSTWLFTPTLVVKIRNSFNQNRIQYEIARLEKSVDWIRLDARSFEFNDCPKDSDCTEDSTLDLEFTTTDGLSSEISAAGKGCAELMEIYRDRFLRNFPAAHD